ncbi:MAG TPA: Crp/Fnr family transcriptional regulator [Sphingomicrobium sp.]|jgi:CRP-like cAMP-binding protein|nr:Crp/Fnr family transcriptional regulator [Sphingomicrobium sp.]
MLSSRRPRSAAAPRVSLKETLIASGLDEHLADMLENMPHRVVQVDPRRTFREEGAKRDEVMFVRSGILAKFKSDGASRRQIVALRFPGEGILPSPDSASYGIQAIVRSEVMVGRAEDFDKIVAANPELRTFFWHLLQRDEAIGYEWLVNCGRRDSRARVAHLLCETAMRSGIDAESPMMLNPFTQQQIADMTGQTSVNVNRVFADLERQGLIERTGREIEFRDWPELRRIASFQPAYLN